MASRNPESGISPCTHTNVTPLSGLGSPLQFPVGTASGNWESAGGPHTHLPSSRKWQGIRTPLRKEPPKLPWKMCVRKLSFATPTCFFFWRNLRLEFFLNRQITGPGTRNPESVAQSRSSRQTSAAARNAKSPPSPPSGSKEPDGGEGGCWSHACRPDGRVHCSGGLRLVHLCPMPLTGRRC